MMRHRHDRLLALDIETVLDRELVPNGQPEGEFAKSVHHRVVAVSFVEARIERTGGSEAFVTESCRSGGEAGYDERTLLAGFWKYFARTRPRLVTWNGRNHDVAVLCVRAMMYGIDISSWSRRLDGAGYRYRYSADWHADVADQLSDFGGSQRLTLDETARALGLPGKIATGQGTVASLHAAGEIDRIRSYCETDALNTIAVYLHWARSTGVSSDADFRRGTEALAEYLDFRRSASPHFGTFLDRWKDAPALGRAPDHVAAATVAHVPRRHAPLRPRPIGAVGVAGSPRKLQV